MSINMLPTLSSRIEPEVAFTTNFSRKLVEVAHQSTEAGQRRNNLGLEVEVNERNHDVGVISKSDRWFSDRRNIFLGISENRKLTNEQQANHLQHHQNSSIMHLNNKLPVTIESGSKQLKLQDSKQFCCFWFHMPQRRGRLSNHLKLSLSSATSICLLSSSTTKLLLQLILIMMLIMIPLKAGVKCPITVASAAIDTTSAPLLKQSASPTTITTSSSLLNQKQQQHEAVHHQSTRTIDKLAQQQDQSTPFIEDADNYLQKELSLETGLNIMTTTKDQNEEKRRQFEKVSKSFSGSEQIPKSSSSSFKIIEKPAASKQELRRQKRAAFHVDQPVAAVGCHQLATFWNFLKSSYPSLTSHLFSLSIAKNDDHLMVQTVKTIARLLEEAEKLIHDQLIAHKITTQNHYLRPATSAWLAKVQTNPAYNRIVQHFQNQHKLAMERHKEHDLNDQQQQISTTNGGEIATANEQDSLASDSHVYGRIIHFPHEANNDATKTLNKLKELNQQRQIQQLHNRQSNEIDRAVAVDGQQTASRGGGGGDMETESNRIPLIVGASGSGSSQTTDGGGDGEPWPQQQQQQQRPSARFEPDNTESARNKYVYGDILLRPNQKSDSNQQHNHRHSSLGTLRQLSNDLDRSMRLNDHESNQQKQTTQKNEPINESYGRILVSPPNVPLDRTQTTTTTGTSEDNKADRSRLHTYSGGGGFSRGLDELANQQHGESVAANPSDEPANSEFEGVWYSGPIQQIGVRSLRSNVETEDRNKELSKEEDVTSHTTQSNPTPHKNAILVD